MSMHYRVFKKGAITAGVILVVAFLYYDFLALPPHDLYTWTVFLSSALITLVFLTTGSVVWIYASNGLVAASYFGFCLATAFVFAGESASILSENGFTALISGCAPFYAMACLIIFLMLFPHHFFREETHRAKGRKGIFVSLVITLLLTAVIMTGVGSFSHRSPYPYPLWLTEVFAIYYFLSFFTVLLLPVFSYRFGERPERLLLLFCCKGVLLSLGPVCFGVGLQFVLLWPALTRDTTPILAIVPVCSSFLVLLPLFLGYAILRSQLFFLDASITRVVTVFARLAISTILIFIILLFALLLPPKFALMFALMGTMICAPSAWWAGRRVSQGLLERYHTIFEQWPDVSASLSLESLLHQMTDSLCTLFHARWSDVLLLDEERGIYMRVQTARPADELTRLLSDRPWIEADSALVRYLLRTRCPCLLWEDRLDEQQFRRVFVIGNKPGEHTALQVAPLWHLGKLIGIALLSLKQEHLPSTASELLTDLLSRYARLLDTARINTLVSERSRWMRGLLQLTTSVFQQDTRDMAQAVVETLLEVIGVGSSVDLWLERNTLLHHTAHAGTQAPPVGTSSLQFVEDASAVYCEDATRPQQEILPSEIAALPGPFAWIPLRHGDRRQIGALLLVTQGPYRYTPYERKLLDVFASHCAAAFVRAERAAQYVHVRDDIAAQVRHREVLLDLAQMSLGEVQEATASPVPRPLPSWPARPPHSQERDPIACVLQEILSVRANTQHLMMQDQQPLPPRLDCAPSGEVWLLCPDEHERAAFELLLTLEGYTPKEMNWHQMIQRLTESSSAPPVAVVIDEDAMPVAVEWMSQGLAEWGLALSQMPPLLMLSTQAPGETGDAAAVVQKPVSLSHVRRFLRGED